MLLQETCAPCPVCGTVTPHRRGLALPWLLVIGVVLLLLGAIFRSMAAFFGGVASAIPAALLRRRPPGRCERCRHKRRAALRATQATLDGRSEISIL